MMEQNWLRWATQMEQSLRKTRIQPWWVRLTEPNMQKAKFPKQTIVQAEKKVHLAEFW
jgi:hypothetical protein